MIHLPTRVDALKREWKKANIAEQREFARWTKAREASARGAIVGPITDAAGHLRTEAAKFLSDWITTNRSKPGRILKQLGRSVHDWRLAHAIYHGGVLPKEIIDKLQPWMVKNGFPR